MSAGDATTVRLRDGRFLAYEEHGAATGWPVFFFQGTPSSRLLFPNEPITVELGVRLISADRPGFGCSDPKPGRNLLDWAQDVEELASALGVGRFAIVGVSGGGPYAAACAYALPERVTRAAILGSAAPPAPGTLAGITWERRVGFWLARHAPEVLAFIIRKLRNPARDPEAFYASYTRHCVPADRARLERPGISQMFRRNYQEAGRQGPQAFIDELLLFARPWGFDLNQIRVPVSIWHSADDNSVPIGCGRALAKLIPNAHTHWLQDEGHLFFADERWRDVLEELLGD